MSNVGGASFHDVAQQGISLGSLGQVTLAARRFGNQSRTGIDLPIAPALIDHNAPPQLAFTPVGKEAARIDSHQEVKDDPPLFKPRRPNSKSMPFPESGGRAGTCSQL